MILFRLMKHIALVLPKASSAI